MSCTILAVSRGTTNWSFRIAIRPRDHYHHHRSSLPRNIRSISTIKYLKPGSKMAEDMPDGGSPLPKPNIANPLSEHTQEDEVWKHRPPYRIQSPEEFGPVKWYARCQCGQVSYRLSRDKPLKAKYCHCRGCQVMHGAPFQWAAIFHKSDLTFDKGASGLSFYSSAHRTRDYEVPTKVSCSFCHTPIMDEGRNVCLIFPEAVQVGESAEEHQKWREAFAPDCHIFYSKRCIEILDGKTKWAEMDEDSELLDDHGRRI